jgi:hypothetical protein
VRGNKRKNGENERKSSVHSIFLFFGKDSPLFQLFHLFQSYLHSAPAIMSSMLTLKRHLGTLRTAGRSSRPLVGSRSYATQAPVRIPFFYPPYPPHCLLLHNFPITNIFYHLSITLLSLYNPHQSAKLTWNNLFFIPHL